MSYSVTIDEINLEYEFPDGFAINTLQSESYIESLKKINKLPFSKGEIYYSDDVWDFSPYTTLNISKNSMRFRFYSFNENFKDDIKNFSLFKVLDNNVKIQSISRVLYLLNSYFTYANSKGIYHVKDITFNTLKEYIDKVKNEESSNKLRKIKWVIKDFYNIYAANFEDLITPEMDRLLEFGDYRAFKAAKEQAKTPDIPNEYFDKLVSSCITVMNDEKEDLLFRAVSCIILILSQTGLRIGECLGLTDNCLQTIKIFNGEESNYLTYKTWKRESGNNTASIVRTYVNDITKAAYLRLFELHKEKREKLNMNYLFMGGPMMKSEKFFPIGCDSFLKMERRFFLHMDKYFSTINLPNNLYPELPRVTTEHDIDVKRKHPEAKTLTYPKNHQFRVHVCTELYNKGVPLKYIEKFMAHLSNEMRGYYVRPKNNPQEDMEFSIKILNDIVSGETRLLGGSNGLSEKIQEFIKKNNYNVGTDMDTICRKLAQKIPIRQKTGGVCIKSSMLRDCSIDAKTNQLYCAYGVCPNIVRGHFYWQ